MALVLLLKRVRLMVLVFFRTKIGFGKVGSSSTDVIVVLRVRVYNIIIILGGGYFH